jgi:hypothetical protein
MFDRAMRDLSRGFAVSHYDIPCLGGYSRDGATIYVDRDTPDQIKQGNRVCPIRPSSAPTAWCIHA